MRMLKGRAGMAIAGLATSAAVAAGVAYATIPDETGVIHGCYSNGLGILRVIDPSAGQQCRGTETSLDWNQTGPQGPSGATNVTVQHADGQLVDPGLQGHTEVFCNPGGRATGGGWHLQFGSISGFTVNTSEPLTGGDGVPDGWSIVYVNTSTGAVRVGAEVVCASP
jgi:hypothetical protein